MSILADKLNSVICDLSTHQDRIGYIVSHRSTQDANVLWDFATLYVFIDQYLHPSMVHLVFKGEPSFTLDLKWVYPSYDFNLSFEGSLGSSCSICLTYPSVAEYSTFQWSPGDLPLGGLMNFLSVSCIGYKVTLGDIYSALIEQQSYTHPYEYTFVSILREALLETLQPIWCMAPASDLDREALIGGLFRRSVTIALNMYSLTAKQISMLERYYASVNPLPDFNRYTFIETGSLELPRVSAVYPLFSFCQGIILQAAYTNSFRIKHGAVLSLSSRIYTKAPDNLVECPRTSFWGHVDERVARETSFKDELGRMTMFFKNIAFRNVDTDEGPFSLFWMYSSKWNRFVEISNSDPSTWTITSSED